MKFAVASAWPEVKNAEYECIERIKLASKNIGVECVVVDNEGYIIGHNDKRTGEYLDGNEVEFVIALHFVTEKLYDCYMYGAMWNPPKFLMDWDYNIEAVKYFTYDDYLIYNSKQIVAHLENLISSTNKDISNAIHFVPSVPGDVMTPQLGSNPKLFYSGINWEKCTNSKGRHHDLFKALDEENMTKIYGPEKFFDAIPWEGFKTYSGSLPFDGISAIKAVNECGMSLVITSDTHRDAEAATNRLYESCAAGAVIISDDNPFVINEFGNSVLYFKYYKDNTEKNLAQIKTHVKWILENKEEALKLAKKSQEIYEKKFKLDNVLRNLVDKHNERKKEVYNYTLDLESKVTVILRCINFDESFRKSALCLNNQINKNNIDLKIICDVSVENDITNFINEILSDEIEKEIITVNLYNDNKRVITSAEMLYLGIQKAKADYVAVLDSKTYWYKEHLGLLLKELTNKNINLTYTGIVNEYYKDDLLNPISRNKVFFHNINDADIYHYNTSIEISSMMFNKNIISSLKNSTFSQIDGLENYLILLKSIEFGNKEFTKKVTMTKFYFNNGDKDHENMIEISWQRRIIRDTIIYSSVIKDKLLSHGTPLMPELDQHSIEVALKTFLKSKIENKYPRLLRFIKIIYNKVIK
ncbi:hypothetical protein PT502_10020 [Aliarcobacter butzleri]|uniref:glycosyltransferase family protein n=1 Tax=Aliarcobacter butzleri TaxID=28197 RepID=UPI0024DE967B|nr:hypothetical protein [Aliarcobacter butzleri]MDK2084130.1 hypothetical protein [Aliarcobacter butzleri]